jgi:TetR/AcrR family transcriptional repressor of bet genes
VIATAGLPETRRRALIDATLVEIADRGSLDVTVAQIAARAGVSSALAHHYFGAKEDLLLGAMRHLLAEFSDEAVRELRAAGGPRARLSAVLRASFAPAQFRHATISAWLAFYAKALSSPGAARLLRVYRRRLRSNLLHALGPLLPRPAAERLAEGVAAMIDGLYLHEALAGRPTAPGRAIGLVEAYVDAAIAEGRR